ncbi:low-density lipoprotein receptor-like [Pteropus vampyrus]|uniref:Low-density lipoprotein receptor-like n=1 Tax=Pteropus vampyrus TaxID=132908 RepID=A0A6P6BL20_PTEVA|nr:low-density lipoprotein receptor-like [Pteropus vampyrus]
MALSAEVSGSPKEEQKRRAKRDGNIPFLCTQSTKIWRLKEQPQAPILLVPPPLPLLCTQSSDLCQNGKECISREYLCDGGRDCQDGSDEETVPSSATDQGSSSVWTEASALRRNTTVMGLSSAWTDELDCWKPTEDCSLLCDNKTHCIPESWLCDGNPDCPDKKDEQGCIHEKCSTSEFRCENGQCISYSLHYDGNRDCLDHSNEDGFPVSWPLRCPSGQVKCPQSGECVLAEWICDHDLDCRDGSDEKDCDLEELWCGSRQWSCASGDQCVPDLWCCDGQRDCRDGSDEAGCECGGLTLRGKADGFKRHLPLASA